MDSLRYVGNITGDPDKAKVFSKSNIELIQNQVYLRTEPHTHVTANVVYNVLDYFWAAYKPPIVGDMYSRYIQPQQLQNRVDQITYDTILRIVDRIQSEIADEHRIKDWTIWTTLYGANDKGLYAHSKITTRDTRAQSNTFNMRF